MTDREGLLHSAALLAMEAVHGSDEAVAFAVDLAIGKDRLCDTLDILSNKYDPKEVAAIAEMTSTMIVVRATT